MRAYSITIVEDDLETLNRLVLTLSRLDFLNVCKTSQTLAEAERYLSQHDTDILLTDLGLPDGSGIDLIRSTYTNCPSTLIMVLSAFGDEQKVISAIMAGAKGYILKSDTGQEISAGIKQLIDGGSPISASIARYLLVQLQGKPEKPKPEVLSLLSPREIEVLELIALGYRNNEIAEKLIISYHTVVNHIRKVYDKLAVSSRSQAINKASKIGLLNTD